MSTSQELTKAKEAHAIGQLGDAEKLYHDALRERPRDPEALHGLGILRYQQGRRSEALELIDQALSVTPKFAGALNSKGLILAALTRYEEALSTFEKALALSPNDTEIRRNRGRALGSLGRHRDALADFDSVLEHAPKDVNALVSRGIALHKLRNYDFALASFDRALALAPRDAEVLDNRGNTLMALDRHNEALECYNAALTHRPNDVNLLSNVGKALVALGRHEEAVASYDRALAIQPDHLTALHARGNALVETGRFDRALSDFDDALKIRSDHSGVLTDRGYVFQRLARDKEAAESYETAILFQPDLALAHWNLGLSLLRLGDFERGWREYEWRWKWRRFSTRSPKFDCPKWLGQESIAGKTILLHAEQGIGDTLQFSRYAPLIAAQGAKVVLLVGPPLQSLLTGLQGVTQVITRKRPLPNVDLHCPLLSLPLALGTTLNTIPAQIPYLIAPREKLAKWQRILGPQHLPRVGIVWSGGTKHKHDMDRSITLRRFLPLTSANAEFFSLQKEIRKEDQSTLLEAPQITHFGEQLDDFGDTAALISLMDLIISVDTAVAHLAGALGKPFWILLPFSPDWRWLMDRQDSPWYPTARLFRQLQIGNWESVIHQIRNELQLRFPKEGVAAMQLGRVQRSS